MMAVVILGVNEQEATEETELCSFYLLGCLCFLLLKWSTTRLKLEVD